MDAGPWLRGETRGPVPALLRALLVPFGVVYGTAASLRRGLHRRWIRPRRWPVPVVSVGNLTVGGTGKTPLVRLLARWVLEAGSVPLIVSRGYGGPCEATGFGDEMSSLLRDLPGALGAEGRDRFEAARGLLGRDPPPDLVILDDGAQALREGRDLEILLADAARPHGAGWPLPAGALREWPRWVPADLLILTGRGGSSGADLTPMALRCGHARHRAVRLLPGGEDPLSLRGRTAVLASGIARPSAFRELAEELGVEVLREFRRPDHARFRPKDLAVIDRIRREAGAELVLATGKDEPRLRGLVDPGVWRFLEVELALDPDTEAWLRARLLPLLRGGGRRA
jgi:tetraacyldisaccharide 4'-kinase